MWTLIYIYVDNHLHICGHSFTYMWTKIYLTTYRTFDMLTIQIISNDEINMSNPKNNQNISKQNELDLSLKNKQKVSPKSNQNLVVKSNRLNEALQTLSLPELRIIQLGIVDARETETGLHTDKPLRIDGKRYSEIFNTTLQNGYILMKQAEETLFNRRFSFINKEGNIVKSRWIQQIEYLDNQGAINICFTKAVVEAITRIDGFEDFFTQYYLEQTAQLKSVYSVRLYELLVQWKVAGKTKLFEVQTFRSQMGVEDSEYKILADFKKRVLMPSIKEINDKTDLLVDFQQQKKGRTVIGFKFSVGLKERQLANDINIKTVNHCVSEQSSKKNHPSWVVKGLTDSQINKIAIYAEEFTTANSKFMSPSFRGNYKELIDSWRPMLKDPEKVNDFQKIQELLDRQAN